MGTGGGLKAMLKVTWPGVVSLEDPAVAAAAHLQAHLEPALAALQEALLLQAAELEATLMGVDERP